MVPTLCEVRRIIPINVPLCFLSDRSEEPVSPTISSESGDWLGGEPWGNGPSREEVDRASEYGPGWVSLNTWTVSVDEETQRRVDVVLNDMLYILEGIEPRRNWYSLLPSGTEKTRIIVPLSDAVARSVPSPLRVIHANGERCASTTLMASSFRVSKIKTSPLVGLT